MICWDCGAVDGHLEHCQHLVGTLVPGSFAARMLAYLVHAVDDQWQLEEVLDPPVYLVGPRQRRWPLEGPLPEWQPRLCGVPAHHAGAHLGDIRHPEVFLATAEELRRKGFISILHGICVFCADPHVYYVPHWSAVGRWPTLVA